MKEHYQLMAPDKFRGENITMDDSLMLLMDSYREQIQLNTKLLERQERMFDRLDSSTIKLTEAINAQTMGFQSMLSTKISELGDGLTKEHGDINLRVYAALGGMVSILVTLIAIWITQ